MKPWEGGNGPTSYVNLDVVETWIGVGKSAERCDCVALNFSPLILKTIASPLMHIGIHTGPNETVGNKALG